MKANDNEILTLEGKRVRVAYTGAANHCNRCCIKGARCRVRLEPCKKYDDPNSPLHAIFVPADEIANKPQMDANKNEPTREKKADFLQTNDADKAANKYARDTFINECMENGSCDANDLADAFKAGIAYERERLMKEAPVADVIEMSGNTDAGYPFVLTLGFPRIPNIEYHGGKVRVIIEEIKE